MNWRIAHTHDRETAAVINRPPYPSSAAILKLNSHFSYDSLLSLSRLEGENETISIFELWLDGWYIEAALAPASLQPGSRAARLGDFTMRAIHYRVVFLW